VYKNFTHAEDYTIEHISFLVADIFEVYLENIKISIPCDDYQDERARKADKDSAYLYGMEYWHLIDSIENWIRTSPLNAAVFPSIFLSEFDKLLDSKKLSKYKPTGEQRAKLKSEIERLMKEEEKAE
jgi:hypothetical protein